MKVSTAVTAVLFIVLCPRHLVAGDLMLQWDVPTDRSIVGYLLSYGTAPAQYLQSVNIGNTTAYTVKGLLDGTTYFFVVRAYDASGNISAPSNEVSATVTPAVVTALQLTASV